MPNIFGQTQPQATATLVSSGFDISTFTLITAGATIANNLTVANQTPTSGTLHNPADGVSFRIFNYLSTVPNVVGQKLDIAIQNLISAGFTNVQTTLVEEGANAQNNNTIIQQTPVNSATTYNPKQQQISLVAYSLGITGRRRSASEMVLLTNAKRFDGQEWQPLTVQKRFNGDAWEDIAN
jgi:beta-lactam-binding protein with PASTA domain